ncbi:MAG: hypothetical protein FJ279_17830 [Planctomycetes bacterium]|nr:hypothetical protein [Planctomycetota bacterium]MBM4079497.1 hypothetical protein [Planctomycetota bacterium]MBM4085652.1 hypothetical protein [Planctomycetota bacterium]
MQDAKGITRELTFLARRTGEDELTLLSRALQLGLNTLFTRTAEQSFIDGEISREEAVSILTERRVQEIEYAKQALTQDIARGFNR